MKKLFKLKQWLTLEQAAHHLSGVCGEPVSEADVLRLGLDGHLKLSVYFVNHARARRGVVVSLEETETCIFAHDVNSPLRDMLSALPRVRGFESKQQLPREVVQGLRDGSLFHCVMDIPIRDGQFLHLADKVESISGVWDLPLIGAERLDVEHAFQQLTGGPEVTLTVLDGTFVENVAGEIAQIQDRFDSPEMREIRQEAIDKLKAMGVKKELKLSETTYLRMTSAITFPQVDCRTMASWWCGRQRWRNFGRQSLGKRTMRKEGRQESAQIRAVASSKSHNNPRTIHMAVHCGSFRRRESSI